MKFMNKICVKLAYKIDKLNKLDFSFVEVHMLCVRMKSDKIPNAKRWPVARQLYFKCIANWWWTIFIDVHIRIRMLHFLVRYPCGAMVNMKSVRFRMVYNGVTVQAYGEIWA